MPYDIICPIYYLNEVFFESFLQSWIKEIDINRILLGINNDSSLSYILKLKKKYKQIELINQTNLKTLGGCLVDLISRVETPWFVYLHSDVLITPYAMKIMEKYIRKDVGIIESHREHFIGKLLKSYNKEIPVYNASDYYFRDRAFSGFQLFQKESIEPLLEVLEDDYIYRNEDIIFQSEIIRNEYKYIKTWAIHIHFIFNFKWSKERKDTYIMQYKGIIKYTNPMSKINIIPLLDALRVNKNEGFTNIYEVLLFCKKHNPLWIDIILQAWDDLERYKNEYIN